MSSNAVLVNDLLEKLDEEDNKIALAFLQYFQMKERKSERRKVKICCHRFR